MDKMARMSLEQMKAILQRGIRKITVKGQKATWCTHCNCFADSEDGWHDASFCPYLALRDAIAMIEEGEHDGN